MRVCATVMRTYKKSLFVMCLGLVEIMLFLSLSPATAHAATHVGGQYSGDVVWDREHSPYIVDRALEILPGSSLTIGPGTQVISAPGANAFLSINGNLHIAGTTQDRVYVKADSLMGVRIDARIENADFEGLNIYMNASNLDIASSTIMGFNGTALYSLGSVIHGEGLRLEGNGVAVGGTLNTFTHVAPDVSIHRSVITGNVSSADAKRAVSEFHMEHNWWGSASGPAIGAVQGPVVIDPWLGADPVPELKRPRDSVCCSSVLFIPGLQASRLYSGTNRLWEPNRNVDVEKLYLNSAGSSTLATVYSGDPIDSAFGVKSIYGGFLDFLARLQAEGTVSEARSFGYDWRKPVNEVVLGTEIRATSTESLVSTILAMASTSKTGKVSIVAHSNGGLVTKYLVKVLADLGKSDIIENIISIAVPYLGTPQSLLGLLHGDGESMLHGLVLSQSTARSLGENMASAYSLLPSREYFSRVFSPTIAFASSTIIHVNNATYPQSIRSFADQTAFVTDSLRGRMKPSATDVTIPLVGNTLLASAADALHAVLDTFVWPANIARYAVVGWNVLTTKGIEYRNKFGCRVSFFTTSCGLDVTHAASTTLMGDGTVVVPSASYDDGHIIPVDLEIEGLKHANIMNSHMTQEAVRRIVEREELPPTETPIVHDSSFVVVSTHSPVDLHIYDQYGNHTGILPKPASLADNDFIEGAYEENIPRSSFRMDGDETYIRLPTDAGQNYTVSIQGNDFGFFTYEVERYRGDEKVGETIYETEPVTPFTVATTTVGSDPAQKLDLRVDVEGDGLIDYVAKTGGNGLPGNATSAASVASSSVAMSMGVMKKIIASVITDPAKQLQFVSRLYKLMELQRKGMLKSNPAKQQAKLERFARHMTPRTLTSEQRKKLTEYIEIFVSSFEG